VIANDKMARPFERTLGNVGGIMTKRALRLSTSAGVLAAVLAVACAARGADADADHATATAPTVAPL